MTSDKPHPISGLRLGVPKTLVLDGPDPEVAKAFDAALKKLSAAGAKIESFDRPADLEVPRDRGRPERHVCAAPVPGRQHAGEETACDAVGDLTEILNNFSESPRPCWLSG